MKEMCKNRTAATNVRRGGRKRGGERSGSIPNVHEVSSNFSVVVVSRVLNVDGGSPAEKETMAGDCMHKVLTHVDYDRTFLPQLPAKVKNRNMEEWRQALRTSSEVYGQFWVDEGGATAGTCSGRSPSRAHVTDQLAPSSRPHQPRWSLPNFLYTCNGFLLARRHVSVGTSYGPVSVSVSLSVYVCHKSVFCRNGWTE